MAADGGDLLSASVSAGSNRTRIVLAAATVVVLGTLTAGVLPGLVDRPDPPSTVSAGTDPAPELPAPLPSMIDVQIAPGWQTLRADRDLLVVATRPLTSRDLLLALLARDDAAFAAFPADGTVFVVGRDRLKAKYMGVPTVGGGAVPAPPTVSGGPVAAPTASPAGAPVGSPATGSPASATVDSFVGPGPPLALGEPKSLRGGVTVRSGDVPQSSVWLAAYAGPRASAVQMQEAAAMAATVKVIAPPRSETPPPPPGSRPGFDQGGVDLSHAQLPAAASFAAPGITYALKAEGDCAVVVAVGYTQPLAGGCQPRPEPASTAVVAVMSDRGPPPIPAPGARVASGTATRWSNAMVILARVGPDVHRVTAVLTDGRTANLTVGTDGWAVGAADGRMFLLEARDRAGKVLAVTPVT